MSSDTSAPQIHQVIGQCRIKGQPEPVKVAYVGGSSFRLEGADGWKANVDKAVIEKIYKNGKLKITSPKQFKTILNAIDPVTGETRTHLANGTPKSKVQQVLADLQEEGYLDRDEKGHYSAREETAPPPYPKPSTPPPSHQSREEEAEEEENTEEEEEDYYEEDDYEEDYVDDYDDARAGEFQLPHPRLQHKQVTTKKQKKFKHKSQEEINEDLQDIETTKNKDTNWNKELYRNYGEHNIPFMVTLIGAGILALILFFGVHGILSMFIHPLNLFNIAPVTSTPEQETTATTTDSSTRQQDTTAPAPLNKSFDPETLVADFSYANDTNKDIATGFFQTLHEAISTGDLNKFNSLVALQAIAQQLAASYSQLAATTQQLTATEKQQLQSFYQSTFVAQEEQHITEQDIDASIFGGRIREIRQNDDDPNKLYVITESIGGDHQRTCFVLETSPGSNSWVLSQILGADDYITMIADMDPSTVNLSASTNANTSNTTTAPTNATPSNTPSVTTNSEYNSFTDVD